MKWPWRKQSYIEKKKQPVKRKRVSREALVLRRQILVGVSLFILVGLLLTALWYGTRIESLQLRSVEMIGGKTISPEMMAETAEQEMAGEYYRLVPRSFSWWYPEEDIIGALSAVPRVKEVRVVKKKAPTLQIAFTEYEPVALWCEQMTDTECFFVDATGYAFSAAPNLSGGALVRYVTGDAPAQKTVAVTSETMRITQETIERLEEELELFVLGVEVDDIDLTYRLTTGAEIKVTTRMTVQQSVANLASILSSDEFAGIADGSFHYIDLRFGDKVFVSESEYVATTTDEVVADSETIETTSE